MRNSPSPSPSEIVMTAILELKQDRGTSLGDIVKYARSKYGLTGDALKNRISAALKRGIKYKIIYLQRGLYHVNKSLCQIPSEPGERVGDSDKSGEGSGKDLRQVKTKKSLKCSSSEERRLKVSSQGALNKQDRKKLKRDSFLCPECRESIKAKTKGSNHEKEGEKNKRYELRPRKTPSQSNDKGSVSQRPKEEEKKTEGRMPWKDYLRMKISLTSRRRNKDKK